MKGHDMVMVYPQIYKTLFPQNQGNIWGSIYRDAPGCG